MRNPLQFNNITSRVVDDLRASLGEKSRLSIAAATFSIYAYEALKEELERVEELRFIFTAPTFNRAQAKKAKREFFIPKLGRERTLFGSDFEIRLRNQLTQRAIAKECADWIRRKARFKSNVTDGTLNNFLNVCDPDIEHTHFGMSAVVAASEIVPPSVIFILKNRRQEVNIGKTNQLHPFYMVYLTDGGDVYIDHLSPKKLLDTMRHACKGKTEPLKELCRQVNKETKDGSDMSQYTELLQCAIESIVSVKEESDVDSLFSDGETSFLRNQIAGLDDFELITFLIIK